MKLFRNLQFIIHSESPHWSKLGYKTKSKDGRLVDIKPLHIQQPAEKGKSTVMMSAEIELKDKPKVSSNKEIIIPKVESLELSTALRDYSNLISVANVCQVGISGPTPSTGFIFESDEEKQFLDSTKGFKQSLIAHIVFSGDFFDLIHQDQLLDRKEGVAFLASANAQTDNVARFHEYIRLFERAFAASTGELAKLIHGFVSPVKNLDYKFNEIIDWMIEKRHGATHADSRENFIFSSDLSKNIDRIKQLAYDVLFNKSTWHERSIDRRDLLKIEFGVISGGMFLTQKKPGDEKTLRITQNDEPFYASSVSEEELKASKFKDPDNWGVRWLPPDNYGKN